MSNLNNIHSIMKFLMEGEQAFIVRKIAEITSQNNKIKGGNANGFMIRGENFYVDKRVIMYQRQTLPHLSDNLCIEGEKFYTEFLRIRDLSKQIEQLFALLLMGKSEFQDIRNALPECVVQFFPDKLGNLPRTAEARDLITNPRTLRTYDKLLPLIEAFSVTKLLL